MTEYIPIFIPAILGFATSGICKIGKDAGASVLVRPPPWVFGIVWIILYAFFGFSWFFANKDAVENKIGINIANSSLAFILALWIIVYGCLRSRIGGVYVLLTSLLAGLVVYTLAPSLRSKLLICPLMVWLLFATLLNTLEVNKK